VKRAGPLTYATIVLLVLFGVTDVAAEVAGDGTGRFGETFSTFIAHLEERCWLVRLLVAAATFTLFTHLTFQIP
jgi:hypothetical protein